MSVFCCDKCGVEFDQERHYCDDCDDDNAVFAKLQEERDRLARELAEMTRQRDVFLTDSVKHAKEVARLRGLIAGWADISLYRGNEMQMRKEMREEAAKGTKE